MACVKRPSNQPNVLEERRRAAEAALTTAFVSPPLYNRVSPSPPTTPLRVRPTSSPSPPPIRNTSRARPHRETTLPVYPVPCRGCASNFTPFSAPRLVVIETAAASDDEISNPAAPSFDLDEDRALNIFRVATQPARRQANSPSHCPCINPSHPSA